MPGNPLDYPQRRVVARQEQRAVHSDIQYPEAAGKDRVQHGTDQKSSGLTSTECCTIGYKSSFSTIDNLTSSSPSCSLSEKPDSTIPGDKPRK